MVFVLVIVSGCVNGEDFRAGLNVLIGAPEEKENVEQTVACLGVSFDVNSARWSGTELDVTVENTGSDDLEGFTIMASSSRGTVTTTTDEFIPAGGLETIAVVTSDMPDNVTVYHTPCPDYRKSTTTILAE